LNWHDGIRFWPSQWRQTWLLLPTIGPTQTPSLANAQLPGGLLHHLFSVRTLQLTNHHNKAIGEDYLSGIIIGHDVLAQLGHSPTHVGIVAAPYLAARYTHALETMGHSCFTIDAQDATVAGAELVGDCLPSVE
jgi:2-dehydro-3-deoxygalactonokinase